MPSSMPAFVLHSTCDRAALKIPVLVSPVRLESVRVEANRSLQLTSFTNAKHDRYEAEGGQRPPQLCFITDLCAAYEALINS